MTHPSWWSWCRAGLAVPTHVFSFSLGLRSSSFWQPLGYFDIVVSNNFATVLEECLGSLSVSRTRLADFLKWSFRISTFFSNSELHLRPERDCNPAGLQLESRSHQWWRKLWLNELWIKHLDFLILPGVCDLILNSMRNTHTLILASHKDAAGPSKDQRRW